MVTKAEEFKNVFGFILTDEFISAPKGGWCAYATDFETHDTPHRVSMFTFKNVGGHILDFICVGAGRWIPIMWKHAYGFKLGGLKKTESKVDLHQGHKIRVGLFVNGYSKKKFVSV